MEKISTGIGIFDIPEEEWIKNAKPFIKSILVKIINNDKINIENFISNEMMKLWLIGFTHESYNFKKGKNYEEYETLGDQLVGAAFVKYLYTQYPSLNRESLSSFKQYYMSKQYQPTLSRKLGLQKYVLRKIKLSIDIEEDIFESFVGVLDDVGNKVVGFGFGYALVYNLVFNLFKDIELDVEKIKPIVTRVKELSVAMHWGRPIDMKPIRVDNITRFEIKYTEKALEFLRTQNINVSQTLAIGEGLNKKLAKDDAYNKAMKNLNELGINLEYARRYNAYLLNKELGETYNKARTIWEAKGYEYTYFKSKVAGHTGASYISLIGVKDDLSEDILVFEPIPFSNIKEGQKAVLETYINMA